jgi:hypothetical protein
VTLAPKGLRHWFDTEVAIVGHLWGWWRQGLGVENLGKATQKINSSQEFSQTPILSSNKLIFWHYKNFRLINGFPYHSSPLI